MVAEGLVSLGAEQKAKTVKRRGVDKKKKQERTRDGTRKKTGCQRQEEEEWTSKKHRWKAAVAHLQKKRQI